MKPLREGGILLAKVHQLAGRLFARRLKERGIEHLNPAQGRIMFALWKCDAVSISHLAQATMLGKSTLTSMLDRLEEDGFIRRKPSPDDRRQTLIIRTDKDRSLQAAYEAVSEEMIELFYKGLTEEERDAFETTLQRILNNLAGEES